MNVYKLHGNPSVSDQSDELTNIAILRAMLLACLKISVKHGGEVVFSKYLWSFEFKVTWSSDVLYNGKVAKNIYINNMMIKRDILEMSCATCLIKPLYFQDLDLSLSMCILIQIHMGT